MHYNIQIIINISSDIYQANFQIFRENGRSNYDELCSEQICFTQPSKNWKRNRKVVGRKLEFEVKLGNKTALHGGD